MDLLCYKMLKKKKNLVVLCKYYEIFKVEVLNLCIKILNLFCREIDK